MSIRPASIESTASERPRRLWHHAAAFVCLLACGWGMWSAAHTGLSRLFSDYGLETGFLSAADDSIRFSPANPDGHYARAIVLADSEHLTEAARALESAIALRPRDYFLWLELGRWRDRMNDTAGALSAFRQAVKLSPHYAEPRWQLGNLLLRTGETNEAFAELRRAVASDPARFAALADLAWGIFGGDAAAVEQALAAQSSAARLALARFFAAHGRTEESLKLFGAAGAVSGKDRRALLATLLAKKEFTEAYQVWSSGRDSSGSRSDEIEHTPRRASDAPAGLIDGSFEREIRLDDPGFGWQLTRDLQAVRVSLDGTEPRAGARSLRVDFSGASPPTKYFLLQLVLVEAGARYQLSFAARTRDVMTGGAPLVIVMDASSADAPRLLAQSPLLPQGTSGWQNFTVEFDAPQTSSAVRIILQRQRCTGAAACPIFGSVWFDAFSLARR